MDEIAKSSIECIYRLAPQRISTDKKIEKQWIRNKVKKAVTKPDHLFPEWVTNPTDFKRDSHRKQRNAMTSKIPKSKTNPSRRSIYRTLRNLTRSKQQRKNDN